MIEHSVETFDTKEEMDFDELTIPRDYSDCDILQEERVTISNNDEFWVKLKNGYGEGE